MFEGSDIDAVELIYQCKRAIEADRKNYSKLGLKRAHSILHHATKHLLPGQTWTVKDKPTIPERGLGKYLNEVRAA